MLAKIFSCISKVIGKIGSFLGACCTYFSLYTLVGLFGTRRFPKAKQYHKLAIVVAARNEATVIGNLMESIRRQDYPADCVSVFVVADNCTDDTARLAREHGAVCYERFDPEHRTKGYALQFLFEQIRRDYGIDTFEAYILFDADNLLKGDFLSRMNEALPQHQKFRRQLDLRVLRAALAAHGASGAPRALPVRAGHAHSGHGLSLCQ